MAVSLARRRSCSPGGNRLRRSDMESTQYGGIAGAEPGGELAFLFVLAGGYAPRVIEGPRLS